MKSLINGVGTQSKIYLCILILYLLNSFNTVDSQEQNCEQSSKNNKDLNVYLYEENNYIITALI